MTLTCIVDETGITAPTLSEIRAYLVTQYQSIYGSDVYLGADCQDGQLLDLFAVALHDANAMAVAVFNAFSPSTAQGEGLSSVVKINGIARRSPTRSSVDLLIGGTAGTIITGGIASDDAGERWNLPATVTIPPSGQVTVTATADTLGAVVATAATITHISTPTRGWQTVTNPLAATVGDPVETDAGLRRRQAQSTMIPSATVFDGVVGAVASLTGVLRVSGAENDTDVINDDGIPPHCFSVVADGGDASVIAETIFNKKGLGTGTYGSTTEVVVDGYGVPHSVKFSRPIDVPISFALTIRALTGYTSNIGDKIVSALVDWVNSSSIGQDVLYSKAFTSANLTGVDSATFDITDLKMARDGGTPTATSITIAYDEAVTCDAGDISISVI